MFKPSHVGNLFVLRDERGRVFYLTLSTSLTECAPSPSVCEMPPDCLDNAHSSSTAGLRDSAASVQKGALLLRVYGVDSPLADIANDLNISLDNCLSEATLTIITSILTRNPQFKLTPNDLRFMKPLTLEKTSTGDLHKTFKMRIPLLVGDMKAYMDCLQRRLLTFLHTVHTRDGTNDEAMRSARASYCEASTEEQNSRGRSNSLLPGGGSSNMSATQSFAFDQSFLTMQDTTQETDTLEYCNTLQFYYNPAFAERRRGPRTPSRMGISFIDVCLSDSKSHCALPLHMAQVRCLVALTFICRSPPNLSPSNHSLAVALSTIGLVPCWHCSRLTVV